jgi:hypothetical protein
MLLAVLLDSLAVNGSAVKAAETYPLNLMRVIPP